MTWREAPRTSWYISVPLEANIAHFLSVDITHQLSISTDAFFKEINKTIKLKELLRPK
jgi:hypothetical protein